MLEAVQRPAQRAVYTELLGLATRCSQAGPLDRPFHFPWSRAVRRREGGLCVPRLLSGEVSEQGPQALCARGFTEVMGEPLILLPMKTTLGALAEATMEVPSLS